jgi:RNA 2',3'-cyclic 3'-phosphodiesterase
MPRLFSAIEIPQGIAARLTLLRARLTGARWIDPENYHLTLRFIGDVDGATAHDFTLALSEIAAAPFELKLNGLGSFGGNKPRAIFAGFAPSEGLAALRRANERAAREAGLPPEGRNFQPHVTLARLRGARADSVAAYLERQGRIEAEPFIVNRFVLYSSRASVGGGPYILEAAYPLDV